MTGTPSALITGGSGFIGSHLVRRLRGMGWRVAVVTRAPQKTSAALADLSPQAIHRCDGSYESFQAALDGARPDVVFHLASYFIAEHKTEDIDPLIASNIHFGTQLLEAMRNSGVKYFVNTGTAWQHFRGDAYDPVCLYAATKQAFEDILYFYAVTGHVEAITLKLFDTYGPGDTRPKLLPALLRAVRSGEILKMSPGEQLLDLVHVDDVVEAYVRGYEWLRSRDVRDSPSFAVSSGAPVTLRQLVATMAELAEGKPRVEWGARPYRAREVMRPWERGSPVPGWAPRVALRDGMRELLRSS